MGYGYDNFLFYFIGPQIRKLVLQLLYKLQRKEVNIIEIMIIT